MFERGRFGERLRLEAQPVNALLLFAWMVAGVAAWGLFLIAVHELVVASDQRKAAKRAAWNRRVNHALGRRP